MTGPAAGEPDVHTLTQLELGRVFHFLLRLHTFIGLSMMTALAVYQLAASGPRWKVLLPAAVAASIILISALDFRLIPEEVSPAGVTRTLLSVLAGMGVVVTLTGGIQSPAIMAIPFLPFVAILATGEPKRYALVAVPAVAGVWALAAGDITGAFSGLLPDFLRRDPPQAAALGCSLSVALVFTLAVLGTGFVGLLIRRALEGALRRAVAARLEVAATMRERNQELFRLSSTVAHELKNPLASIQGLASLQARHLEEGSPHAERMAVLLREVKRMGGLLEEFLNFSRPIGELTLAPVDAAALARDVVELHHGLAHQRGVRITPFTPPAAPLTADRRKLRQALVNVVQNAIDACKGGGAVTVRVSSHGEQTAFEVSDDGTGLPGDRGLDVFKGGTTTKAHGSGLGLTIARTIAEQHGGKLTLDNRADGPGCLATMALPSRPPQASAT